MVAGARAVTNGTMTLGDLVLFVYFTQLLTTPLIEIAAIGTGLSEAVAGLDRIAEVKRVPTERDEDAGHAASGNLIGTVTFENVSFCYVPTRLVLRDVSFVAAAGSTTALVGPSGAGKSTLIALVMGFERPTAGRILVGGHDLATIDRHDYRRQLGVVLQDAFLFAGTLRENIAYSRSEATEEEIRWACEVAHCDEFIARLEHGLDTVVGERGVRLSGGQRQRAAIARAVLADPQILILDEATSNVDPENEALIQDALRALRRGRTTFVIAHRLSTIRSADRILVLEDGVIVERGTHAELLRNGTVYRRLYRRQAELQQDVFVNPGEDESPPRRPLGMRPAPEAAVEVPL
jgi:ABC-type multidrug transport system fused ATPase/permease subunit